MTEEQIYNPVTGINQMISDIEDFVNPMIFKLQPFIRLMGIINVYLVITLFFWMIYYLVFRRKHRITSKLKDSRMYVFAGIMLALYVFLSKTPIKIGPVMSINLGIFVMPIFAKKYGPLMGGIFGLLQYIGVYVLNVGGTFDLSTMLLASVSGMIYGRFLYMRKLTYLRCFLSKLVVNVVCNIIFVPMLTGDSLTTEVADSITHTIVSNIILAPIQAVVIYYAFKALKRIERFFTED